MSRELREKYFSGYASDEFIANGVPLIEKARKAEIDTDLAAFRKNLKKENDEWQRQQKKSFKTIGRRQRRKEEYRLIFV